MKFIKIHRRLIIGIVIPIIFLLTLIGFNKNPVLKYIGDQTFGGCCYNLTIAKAAYTAMSWRLPMITLPNGKQITNDKPPQWANHQLARIDFVSGDFPSAMKHINEELANYPDNLNAYYIKGLILGFTANTHEAIQVFEYYTSKTSTWAGHNDLAWLYFKIGDYKNAFKTIDKIHKQNPNNIWVLNTRAISLYNLKRYKEAKIDIDNALANYKTFTPERWGASYPGNDPSIYSEGYEQMGKSLEANKTLIYEALKIKPKTEVMVI